MEIVKSILNKKVEVILIIVGLIMIVFSCFTIKDRSLVIIQNINYVPIVIGSTIFILGLLGHIIPQNFDFRFQKNNIKVNKTNDDNLEIVFKEPERKINIIFGTLDDFSKYEKNSLLILPANDQFDDDCIDDESSALGSMVKKIFPNKIEIAKEHISRELNKRDKKIFDVGQWVYLDLNRIQETDHNFKIGFLSVTHLLENRNIKAYSKNIFLAFHGINTMMQKKSMSKVFLPLLGSGHGGLSPKISLLCLLISCTELIKKGDGNRLKDVNVVIYKPENSAPAISFEETKKIIKFVINNSCV